MVDVHQRAGLVEPDGGERDAEFGGDQGQAALLPFVGGVEVGYGLASSRVVCFGHDLFVHEWDVPVFELLVEVGDFVWLVEVDFSEGFNRHAKLVCNLFHERLGDEHALRATKASEGGVGHCVCLREPASDMDVRDKIAAVDV